MAGRKKHTTKGPVNYERPKILIRTRQSKQKFGYDKELAEQILAESLASNAIRKASPKGRCYICDTKIPPMRKLCGKCLAKREVDHQR
jgi:hypothetical protein